MDTSARHQRLLGMVKLFDEFPKFHATFNMVPSLCMQLEEYASGKFNEPWFNLAFKITEALTREDKNEILARAFQVNHERLMSRWPRFVELYEWSRPAGGAQAVPGYFYRARLARFATSLATRLDG